MDSTRWWHYIELCMRLEYSMEYVYIDPADMIILQTLSNDTIFIAFSYVSL